MTSLPRWRAGLVALTTISWLASCSTELRLHRAGEGDASGPGYQAPYVGIPYPLMYTAYDLEITHRVVKCEFGQYRITTSVELQGTVTAPDQDNMFLIDPNSMYGPFKSGKLSVTYLPNGAVASLNASADDKTAAMVGSLVTGAIKSRLVPPLAAAAAAVGLANACPAGGGLVQEALTNMPVVTYRLGELSKDLKAKGEAVKGTLALITAAGTNVPDSLKTTYVTQLEALGQAQEALAAAKKESKQLLDTVSLVDRVRWPAKSSELAYTLAVNQARAEKKWPNVDATRLDVGLALSGLRTIGATPARLPNIQVDARLGLPYRLARTGTLRVCEGPCREDAAEYFAQNGPVLQLGDVFYLPCRSPAFTSTSCEMVYADTGELKSMGAARPVTAAEAFSGMVKDGATQYSDYRIARRAYEEAEAEKVKAAATAPAVAAAAARLSAVAAASVEPGAAGATVGLAEADAAADMLLATTAVLRRSLPPASK